MSEVAIQTDQGKAEIPFVWRYGGQKVEVQFLMGAPTGEQLISLKKMFAPKLPRLPPSYPAYTLSQY